MADAYRTERRQGPHTEGNEPVREMSGLPRWFPARTTILAVILALGPIAAARVSAQSRMTVVPSVSVSTVYDDNLFASTQGDVGVMTRLRPSVEGNYESPTLTLLSLYSFDMQRSNHSALNSFGARRHGAVDLQRRTAAANTFGLGLRYDRTDTPGELNGDTGFLGERRVAERWEAVPAFAYRVRPRTTISASYAGISESLVDDIRGNLHIARAGVSREVSTRDDVTVSYLGRHFVDALGSHTSHAALVAWTRELAFQTRLTLQGGPRHSVYQGITPEIVVGLTRSTNRVRIGVDYWHGETIVLGIRGPVAVDSANARLIWPVRPRVEIGTHLSASDSSTLDGEDARVYRATLVGAWTPNGGPYTVSASYGGDVQRGVIRRTRLSQDRIMRHTFLVNVTIAPRLSRSFRPTGEPPVARPHGVAQ